MSAKSDIPPGTVLLEKYRTERELASGAMGTVIEATHLVTGKKVAVKVVHAHRAKDPGVQKRLLREARVAARIEHPNVVDIYDVGAHEGSIVLVMELLRGRTFGDWLEQHAPIPAGELIPIVVPALRGLAAVHAEGVIHRDLKPHNLFLCEDVDGSFVGAKVLDLGLATEGEHVATVLTAPNQLLGTPAYIAPEQLEGGVEPDVRVDVYAVGVILYEALTGQRPFEADTLIALVRKILDAKPTPPHELREDVPEALSAVVLKAMARDPAARFADVPSLVEALLPFGARPSAPVVVRASKSSEPLERRTPWLVVGAAALLAAIALVYGVPALLGDSGSSEPATSDEPSEDEHDEPDPRVIAEPADPASVPDASGGTDMAMGEAPANVAADMALLAVEPTAMRASQGAMHGARTKRDETERSEETTAMGRVTLDRSQF